LVYQVVESMRANARAGTAHAKDRGAVSGGGKKPWAQKGTGRARHGSSRSPIWVGGGITFGPTNERNYSLKMNRKARRKALAMALSDKVVHNAFVAIDSLVLGDAKTKTVVSMLKKLPLVGKKTLVVLEPSNMAVVRATRNLPRVSTISANSLNVVDLLANDCVLTSKDAVEILTKTFTRA